MSASTRVVITGLGAVTPLGATAADTWTAMCAGQCGLGPLTQFDASQFAFGLGGEVSNETLVGDETQDRASRLVNQATREAWAQAGLPDSHPYDIILGTNFGSVGSFEQGLGKADTSLQPSLIDPFNTVIDSVVDSYSAVGSRQSVSLSCSSGTAALGEAFHAIRRGQSACVVAGGYDALSVFAWSGLCVLRTMTTAALRPFHAERDGTLFSEGAGILICESLEHAQSRGATILAEVRGYHANNNAFHMTAPSKDGSGLVRTMQGALKDAGLAPEAIDHVNVHGTGTPYNDISESLAIHTVFGGRGKSIPVTSNKSQLGHTMGAAGALEAIASVQSLLAQRIAPTIGLDNQDPDCDVTVVANDAQDIAVSCVMSNSSGIGGNNASVVLSTAGDLS